MNLSQYVKTASNTNKNQHTQYLVRTEENPDVQNTEAHTNNMHTNTHTTILSLLSLVSIHQSTTSPVLMTVN